MARSRQNPASLWKGCGTYGRADDRLKFREPFQLLDERRALEVEELRRLPFVAAGALERSFDQLAFDVRDECVQVDAVLGQRDRRRENRLPRLLDFRRQIVDVDLQPA